MKFLNIIDLAFQTFILGAVALLSLGIAFTGSLESMLMVAFYGAIFLGPWQLVSSVITTISRGLYFKLRVIHLVSSLAYIVAFSLLAAFPNGLMTNGILPGIASVIGFFIPLGLAVFYYYITLKSFQLSRAMAKSS
jgi:hypothetical protein